MVDSDIAERRKRLEAIGWNSGYCKVSFWGFNPLSPNSDQHQFSPNNIHTLSRDKVMRINKMIIIEKIPWSFIKFSQLILKGNVWRSVWRICMWILGFKGLRDIEIQCILRVNQVCIWLWG